MYSIFQLRRAIMPLIIGASIYSPNSMAIASLAELPPQIDSMQLQLKDGSNGILMLSINASERRRIITINSKTPNSPTQGAAFLMYLGDNKVLFSDDGTGVDSKSGDGIFSGKLTVDINRLTALNDELALVKNRSIPTFTPRDRIVNGKATLPNPAFDLTSLKAGRTIKLPNVSVFKPIKNLGAITTADINPQKSLLITSIPVIEDPARTYNPCTSGAANNPLKSWTFGHLMNQMATGSGMAPGAFVENWLNNWKVNRSVMDSSGALLLDETSSAALANMNTMIINPWRARSGGGALDLRVAPFRLNAIIYRPDLALSNPYGLGGGNNGGELRFVFGMMDVRDNNGDGDAQDPGDVCRPIESAVIFEYGVPLANCPTIKNWANEWATLSTLLPGSVEFGNKLQTLTQQVVMAGSAPSKPNQNALNQLRTNEIDLTGIWQFREFVIRTGNGPLVQTTTKNQPREHQAGFTSTMATPSPINLDGTNQFLNEVLANQTDIINEQYSVPETSVGLPFRGGASSYNLNTFWDHASLTTAANLDARFKFSKNTCSGCHTRETNTTFYHIRPMGPGNPPQLSPFLQGPLTVADPTNFRTGGALMHSFDEMANRSQALSNLANQSCGIIGTIPFEVIKVPMFINE